MKSICLLHMSAIHICHTWNNTAMLHDTRMQHTCAKSATHLTCSLLCGHPCVVAPHLAGHAAGKEHHGINKTAGQTGEGPSTASATVALWHMHKHTVGSGASWNWNCQSRNCQNCCCRCHCSHCCHDCHCYCCQTKTRRSSAAPALAPVRGSARHL